MSAEQDLYNSVTDGLWSVVDRLRSQAAATLADLTPEPGFTGTPLDQRLLTAFDPSAIAAADAGVSTLLNGLKKILPPISGGPPVTLHGFDPGNGQPRSVAAVFVTSAPALTFVAAITGDGPQGLAFELALVGAGAFGPVTLPLQNSWSLALSGNANGGGRLQFPRGGTPNVLDGVASISVTLSLQHAASAGNLTIGPSDGPHVSVAGVTLGGTTGIDGSGNPKFTYIVSLQKAQLSLLTDVLKAILGDKLSLIIDVDLAADPEGGISLKGGGVRTTIPANIDLPGIDISAVNVALQSSASGLDFNFGIAFTGGFPGVPLTVTVDGLGAGFPITTGSSNLGIDPSAVHAITPTGLGIDLDVPVVSGGGFLETTGPGAYGGVLDVSFLEMSIDAFGLLQMPVNGLSLSFVLIISVEFPLPGIELGFGFSLNGVGGIVAVNRRLDAPAMQAAIIDGSAKRLLFPIDPAKHGPAIVATLGHVFPAADGHFVVGPMLEVNWGGRILSIVLAVVIDLPNPVQFAIIGRITVALPDPAAPLVLLQATIFGDFELSPTPSFSLLASLDGSKIAGMPLDGDIYFLTRGGDDAEFVLSAGGFHPRYVPPAGVPSGLRRLQLDITPPGFPGLRSEAYFAVTSNSVQFGARIELRDEIAGCGLDGWFSFDALFKWDPVFSFSIRASAGVAVQVLGETLMGINVDLTIEGPSPWHIHGSGSVDLFLFSASLDFDVHWGDQLPAPPAIDLAPVLAAAFARPGAWTGAAPTGENSFVTLSSDAKKVVSSGQAVHPLGRVQVRERVIPLDIQIARFQRKPVPPQTWSILSANLAPAVPAALGDPILDRFAPGDFLDLTQDQQLSRPSFEQFDSGVIMTPVDLLFPDFRAPDTSYEVLLEPDIVLVPPSIAIFNLLAESFLSILDVHDFTSLWSPPNLETVSVAAQQPMTAATTDTITEQPVFTEPAGFTATLQAAQAKFGALGPNAPIQIVEHWEVVAS